MNMYQYVQAELPLPVVRTHSMRWRDRRELFRRIGPCFEPARHGVELIEYATAKRFVVQNHYSGTMPYTVLSVGLFRKAARVERAQLAGVAVFATPSNLRTFPSYTGLCTEQGLELGRFVLLDQVEANAETWFLRRALELLRAERPVISGVLSYSDPMPRTRLDGSVRFCGHTGMVYSCSSAEYLGRGRSKRMFLTPDGRALANRILNKVRAGECGHRYAERALEDASGFRRDPEEPPEAFVERVIADLRSVRHPGNHVFFFPIGSPSRRRAILANPRLSRRQRPISAHPRQLDHLPVS